MDSLDGLIDSVLNEAEQGGVQEKKSAPPKPAAKKRAATRPKPPVRAVVVAAEVEKDPTPEPPAVVLGLDRGAGKVGELLTKIEKRFLEVTGLGHQSGTQADRLQVKTNKSKSDAHGEVFTPLPLAKQMVEKARDVFEGDVAQNKTTTDLCAGYGQFTLMLMRDRYEGLGEAFKITKFLGRTHLFIELQPGSCYRLLSIFGSGIRLLMGDASKIPLLPDDAEKGVWIWVPGLGGWVDGSQRVRSWLTETNKRYPKDRWDEKASYFEGRVDEWLEYYNG